MAAAYLKCLSASAPAQFCGSIPFFSRRNALSVLRRGNLSLGGEVFKCSTCGCWHIRPHAKRKGLQS